MGGKCDNKKWDLNRARPFPRVLGYKGKSDIKEVGITEFKAYCYTYYTLNENISHKGRSHGLNNKGVL